MGAVNNPPTLSKRSLPIKYTRPASCRTAYCTTSTHAGIKISSSFVHSFSRLPCPWFTQPCRSTAATMFDYRNLQRVLYALAVDMISSMQHASGLGAMIHITQCRIGVSRCPWDSHHHSCKHALIRGPECGFVSLPRCAPSPLP